MFFRYCDCQGSKLEEDSDGYSITYFFFSSNIDGTLPIGKHQIKVNNTITVNAKLYSYQSKTTSEFEVSKISFVTRLFL